MPLYCHISDVAGAESRIWGPIQHEIREKCLCSTDIVTSNLYYLPGIKSSPAPALGSPELSISISSMNNLEHHQVTKLDIRANCTNVPSTQTSLPCLIATQPATQSAATTKTTTTPSQQSHPQHQPTLPPIRQAPPFRIRYTTCGAADVAGF